MLALSAHAADPAGDAANGRKIFFSGERDSGEPLTANVGGASIPVPATALPCAGCHGRDGTGREEGGVKPSNITWDNLSRSYGGTAPSGRKYQAYDESSFLRVITEGVDSNGNRLDTSMPRFNLSRQDARDLIAYLKVIRDDYDPGVSDSEIVIGTLQPSSEVQKPAADALTSVIRAMFDEINREGGIYGRQLKLDVVGYEDRQSFVGQANRMIDGGEVFALVAPYSATADQALTDLVEKSEIPSIAPFTEFPTAKGGQHSYTFYLHGGLDSQVGALARRAAESLENKNRAYVVYKLGGGFEQTADDAAAYLKANGFGEVKQVAFGLNRAHRLPDLVDLGEKQSPAVMFIGTSSDLLGLLPAASNPETIPRLYVPGYFVTSHILQLPPEYAENLEMSFINVPGGGEDSASLNDFREFMLRNRIGFDFQTIKLFGYSAVRTLVEGIKKSGKRITRKKVIESIEELYGFDVGMSKPINYGSRRRTGILGAYIVTLDKKQNRLSPTGEWVRLD